MEVYNLSDEIREKNRKTPDAPELKVTAIKPAMRNERRVNIYIDEKYEFSLDLAQVVDYKLKVGQKLTSEKIEEYKHASEFGKLYQRTLEWILMRPRSIKETRDHLVSRRKKRELENRQAERNRERLKNETKEEREARKAREEKFGEKTRLRTKESPLFSDDDIEKIISILIEKGYLDDYNFAKYYVENRNARKGTSVKKLRLELAKKGIENGIISELLDNSTFRDDESEIQKIIAKKRRKYDDEKLIQYLVRQGFDYQLARAAVSETD